MNYFSKKNDKTLLILSIIFITISSLLILFSENLSKLIHSFLQNVIFKREFDFSKWQATSISLLAFPVFIVVFLDALLFPKFLEKSKNILIASYFTLFAFLLTFTAFTKGYLTMDSDMASEILLAKECYLTKSFLPKSWHYSTEIRMLNSQIISSPIFIFTKNLNAVKSISVFIINLLLPLSLLFLLNELKIESKWLKSLSLLLIFIPWSSVMWKYVQYGSYYVAHIAIAFTYFALFLSVTYNKDENNRIKHIILLTLFFALSFISGLSGIRYILYFELPLLITVISQSVTKLFKNNETFNFKSFFIEDKKNHFSIASIILGGTGYVFNTLVLSRIYSFSDFNTTAFTHIGDITFSDVHNAIFEILGYKNNVSVFTPSGFNNILIYIFVSFFLISLITFMKKETEGNKKTFVLFSIILFVFNAFAYINTEYISRYFILILAFIIPTFTVFAESKNVSILKKYFMIFSLSQVMISNCFIVIEEKICSNENKEKKGVTEFLLNSDYEAGYGTFWNANIFNFLTNDKVKIANLYKNKEKITDTFKVDKWLTPESYYQNSFGNGKNVFLIVTKTEYEEEKNKNIYKNGNLVYSDDYYLVFDYESNETFKNSF